MRVTRAKSLGRDLRVEVFQGIDLVGVNRAQGLLRPDSRIFHVHDYFGLEGFGGGFAVKSCRRAGLHRVQAARRKPMRPPRTYELVNGAGGLRANLVGIDAVPVLRGLGLGLGAGCCLDPGQREHECQQGPNKRSHLLPLVVNVNRDPQYEGQPSERQRFVGLRPV